MYKDVYALYTYVEKWKGIKKECKKECMRFCTIERMEEKKMEGKEIEYKNT